MSVNTKSYEAKDIESVETVLDHIRLKPTMYGFSPNQKGMYQLLKEIIDNSIDEAKITKDKKHLISITFVLKAEGRFQVIITDTGRGIPLHKLDASYTKYGTSGKWSPSSYTTSIGTFGVGVKATNALSKFITVISRRRDGFAIVHSRLGKTMRSEVLEMHPEDRSLDGVTVIYEPDWTVYKDAGDFFEDTPDSGIKLLLDYLDFEATFVRNIRFSVKACSIAEDPDYHIGAPIEDIWRSLYYKRETNSAREIYLSPENVSFSSYVLRSNGINAPVLWESPIIEQDINVDGRLGYTIQTFLQKDFGKRSQMMVAAVNMVRIQNPKASHVFGTISVIKKMLMKKIADVEMRDYFENFYQLPGGIIIMAEWQGANFDDQAKNNFSDNEFLKQFTASLIKACERLGDDFWKDYLLQIFEDVEERYKRFLNRDLKSNNGLKNLKYTLNNPDCYLECVSRDKTITEIFFAEGDSSGDYIKQHRNAQTQAVYKCRGKPTNPFKKETRQLRSSEMYQDLSKILGVSPTDTNLDNMNFATICLLADADCDGYHIRSLCIGTLYKINPLIVTSGRVIMINPPLYLLLHKKLRIFARDAHALMDQRVDMYNSLLRIKVYGEVAHHELSGAAFRDFCYLIYEVGRIINAVATKLIIDPHILESLVSVVDHLDPINPEKIKEGLALDHCEYRKESDSLILTVGNVDTVIQCKDLATEIRMNVLPTLRAVKHNRIYVTVTTRHSPLYNERMMTYLQLYQVFQTINEYFVPSRLKGLAQVPPAQLVHVCLDPLTRSYTKITNVGDVDIIHEIFGVATKLRKMLIQENLQDLEQVLKFKGAKDDDYIDAE